MKKGILLAGVFALAQAGALTLSPTSLGFAGKDKDYVYGVTTAKSGSPITENIITVGTSPINSGLSVFCDEYHNQGILNDSYVIKIRSFQASASDTVTKSFKSSNQDDWTFGTLLGCGTGTRSNLREETFYIPTKNPEFAMPYPLREFKAKLTMDQNMQVTMTITPK